MLVFSQCNIVAYAYGGEYKVYSTSGEFLKYCESCGSNDWFRWRIKADRPTDMTAIESESACNTGSNSITEASTLTIDSKDMASEFSKQNDSNNVSRLINGHLRHALTAVKSFF